MKKYKWTTVEYIYDGMVRIKLNHSFVDIRNDIIEYLCVKLNINSSILDFTAINDIISAHFVVTADNKVDYSSKYFDITMKFVDNVEDVTEYHFVTGVNSRDKTIIYVQNINDRLNNLIQQISTYLLKFKDTLIDQNTVNELNS